MQHKETETSKGVPDFHQRPSLSRSSLFKMEKPGFILEMKETRLKSVCVWWWWGGQSAGGHLVHGTHVCPGADSLRAWSFRACDGYFS